MSLSPDRLPAHHWAPASGSAPGSASGTFAIETHGLSKHFGKLTAVDGLTFSVPAGTIAGFIGPNGAGKTTTIRLLLGLVRPDAGSATILGQPLTNSLGYLPRVGALIEAPAFYPSLSARANLEVLARLGGYPSSRVREVLDPLGIIATRDLLRRLREQGKTIFLSSHLLGELEQVADWLVMLHQGKALYNGPARAFLDQHPGVSFEERFLALLKGEHQ